MTDQDKENLIKKYRENPSLWVEDMFPDIKLFSYQKLMLKTLITKDRIICLMKKGMR